MSVKSEPNGRRSVTVETEVPGTPEQVWQAIATGLPLWDPEGLFDDQSRSRS